MSLNELKSKLISENNDDVLKHFCKINKIDIPRNFTNGCYCIHTTKHIQQKTVFGLCTTYYKRFIFYFTITDNTISNINFYIIIWRAYSSIDYEITKRVLDYKEFMNILPDALRETNYHGKHFTDYDVEIVSCKEYYLVDEKTILTFM